MANVQRGKIQRGDLGLWDGVTKTSSRVDATGGTQSGLTVGDYVDVLQVFGGGDTYTVATITAALNHVGTTNNMTLLFATGTWVIDADVTIPSNLSCHIPAGTVFAISSGKTITFSGPAFRESETWTSGAGATAGGVGLLGEHSVSGDIARNGAVSGSNSTTAIQATIDANADVWVPVGTFLTDQITITSAHNISGVGTLKLIDSSTISANEGMLQITGDDVVIDGVTLDGNKAGQSVDEIPHVIVFEQADRGRVRNLTIKNAKGAGINGRNSAAFIASDVQLNDGDAWAIFFGMNVDNGAEELEGPQYINCTDTNKSYAPTNARVQFGVTDGSAVGGNAAGYYRGSLAEGCKVFMPLNPGGSFLTVLYEFRGLANQINDCYGVGGWIGATINGEGNSVNGGAYESCEKYGVELTGAENMSANGVTVRGKNDTEIAFATTGLTQKNISFNNCQAFDCERALSLLRAQHVSISGLTSRDMTSRDINIDNCRNVSISGGSFSKAGTESAKPIALTDSKGISIAGGTYDNYTNFMTRFGATITDTFVDGNVTVGTDRITMTAHPFASEQSVVLTTSGVLPAGLALATTYYTKYIDANTVELYSDEDLVTIVDITAAAGGGTHTITQTHVFEDINVTGAIVRNLSGLAFAAVGGAATGGTPFRAVGNIGIPDFDTPITLNDNATPTVLNGRNFLTGGTTTITDFDNGVVGQTIQIRAAHSVTITDNAAIELAGGNYGMTASDTLTLTMYTDQVWTEDTRSVN